MLEYMRQFAHYIIRVIVKVSDVVEISFTRRESLSVHSEGRLINSHYTMA